MNDNFWMKLRSFNLGLFNPVKFKEEVNDLILTLISEMREKISAPNASRETILEWLGEKENQIKQSKN